MQATNRNIETFKVFKERNLVWCTQLQDTEEGKLLIVQRKLKIIESYHYSNIQINVHIAGN